MTIEQYKEELEKLKKIIKEHKGIRKEFKSKMIQLGKMRKKEVNNAELGRFKVKVNDIYSRNEQALENLNFAFEYLKREKNDDAIYHNIMLNYRNDLKTMKAVWDDEEYKTFDSKFFPVVVEEDVAEV